jgi:ketosteroid isomerase-like protein
MPARSVKWIVVIGAVLVGVLVSTERGYAQASDPMAVFNAFHAAVNAHDVDAALAFFAPDAVVQFPNQPPPNVFRGTQEIRTWLQGDAAQHIQVTTDNVQVTGDRMTWDASVMVDDLRPLGISADGSVEAVIQGGKITSFVFTLSEDTLAKLQAATAQPQAMPRTGGAPTYLWWLVAITGLGVGGLGLALRARARG